MFIHGSPEGIIDLYNSTGELCARMTGVEFLPTTLEGFGNTLRDEEEGIPIFIEEWIPSSSGSGPPLHPDSLKIDLRTIRKELLEYISEAEANGAHDSHNAKLLDNAVADVILLTLIKLGWTETTTSRVGVGTKFYVHEIMISLGIKEEYALTFRRFLSILVEEGFLSLMIENEEFEIRKEIPDRQELDEHIELMNRSRSGMDIEWSGIFLLKEKLGGILSGKINALEVFFSDGEKSEGSFLDKFYTESEGARRVNNVAQNAFDLIMEEIRGKYDKDRVLHLVEIGGGIGSATEKVLPVLERQCVKYSYTFTDISSAFFPSAKDKFNAFSKSLKFQCLNIEKHPKDQGFAPGQTDIIIAANVLHATKDLAETLQNVRHLLKPSGVLLIVETFKPVRLIDISFGLIEGYWRFKDFDLRPSHCLLSVEKWEKLLLEHGFRATSAFPVFNAQTGVIIAQATDTFPQYNLRDETSKGKPCCVIFSDESNFSNQLMDRISLAGTNVIKVKTGSSFIHNRDEIYLNPDWAEDMRSLFHTIKNPPEAIIYSWSLRNDLTTDAITRSFLNFLQALLEANFPKFPKLLLLTRGVIFAGDQEILQPKAATLQGLARTFQTENPLVSMTCLDLSPNGEELQAEIQVEQVINEVWREESEKEPLVAYRNESRLVGRLAPCVNNFRQFSALPLLTSERTCLKLPTSRNISDLKFGAMSKSELGKDEIEVKVHASALNFRDIFSIIAPFKNAVNPVGADFAGTVCRVGDRVIKWKVGDEVFGINRMDEVFVSHVTTNENLVIKVPQNFTFTEAATLPIVFSTVQTCLVNLANLQRDEWLLLHTASGGVGLCAIQVATNIGAKIIATAGSRRKRAYLRSLGLQHVYSSRDLEFRKYVDVVTGGKGVNVVLNSLTGPGFKETSLTCCAIGARFVEMSKRNIWTDDAVKNLRADVVYFVVDVSRPQVEEAYELMHSLGRHLTEATLKPIPYTRFEWTYIRDALKFLESAKHIGKVVLVAPTERLFNDRSTYLITGGLRGIGLEVAKWMVANGAKHLVLCSRTPPSNECLDVISELSAKGVNVIPFQADVAVHDDVRRLLSFIQNHNKSKPLPPLRGIMHCAGTLADGIIPNQTWDKFQTTMRSKVGGTQVLHDLTLNYQLEHFVLFSSVVAVCGPPGQSNYAAANSFMDAFAHYLQGLGLPATSINWGVWGEVGMVAGRRAHDFESLPTKPALKALKNILEGRVTQACVCYYNKDIWNNNYPWARNTYFSNLAALDGAKNLNEHHSTGRSSGTISSTKFWAAIESAEDKPEKIKIVKNYIAQIVAHITQLDMKEELWQSQDWQEFGMDSLMLIELRNQIQGLLGQKFSISSNLFLEYRNLGTLSVALVQEIENVSVEKFG